MRIIGPSFYYQLATSAAPSDQSPLLRLWGKTTDDPAIYHPALYHMLDVGHVAQQLLSERATSRWRRVLGRALNADADTLRDWLPWVVALHDIGKLSVPFQAQSAEQRRRLGVEGVLCRHVGEHLVVSPV